MEWGDTRVSVHRQWDHQLTNWKNVYQNSKYTYFRYQLVHTGEFILQIFLMYKELCTRIYITTL